MYYNFVFMCVCVHITQLSYFNGKYSQKYLSSQPSKYIKKQKTGNTKTFYSRL